MRYAYCILPGCRCDHRYGVPAEQIGEGRQDYEYREEAAPSTRCAYCRKELPANGKCPKCGPRTAKERHTQHMRNGNKSRSE